MCDKYIHTPPSPLVRDAYYGLACGLCICASEPLSADFSLIILSQSLWRRRTDLGYSRARVSARNLESNAVSATKIIPQLLNFVMRNTVEI
jgi:hypothetical protein